MKKIEFLNKESNEARLIQLEDKVNAIKLQIEILTKLKQKSNTETYESVVQTIIKEKLGKPEKSNDNYVLRKNIYGEWEKSYE